MLQILGFRAPGKANLPGTLGRHCRDLVPTFRAKCFLKSTVPAFSSFSEFRSTLQCPAFLLPDLHESLWARRARNREKVQHEVSQGLPAQGNHKGDAALLLTVGTFLLTVELFSLRLTILAFLLTVIAFLFTVLAFLTVLAYLLTVGKRVY